MIPVKLFSIIQESDGKMLSSLSYQCFVKPLWNYHFVVRVREGSQKKVADKKCSGLNYQSYRRSWKKQEMVLTETQIMLAYVNAQMKHKAGKRALREKSESLKTLNTKG